jgi:hypothetical protein
VGEALKELAHSRRWRTPGPTGPPTPPPPTFEQPREERRSTPLKKALWEAVQEFKGSGMSKWAIARAVGIDRKTVRRYLVLDHPPVCAPRRDRGTNLGPHLAYIRDRWIQGCQNARQIYRELLQRGYTGSATVVKMSVRSWRSSLRLMSSAIRPSAGSSCALQAGWASPRRRSWSASWS